MEENIIIENEYINKNRGLSFLMGALSALISFFIAGFSIYLVTLGNLWFITLSILFILEGASIIAPLFIKDDYQAMHLQGIAQIIGVVIFMPFLLFMILWNDADGLMDYSLFTYLAFSGAAFIKLVLFISNRLIIKRDYHPLLHAYGNGSLIVVYYLLLIIQLIIVNQFYPGNSTALFDNLLQEKPLWIYIIEICTNGLLTVLAAFAALSTDIKARTRESLSPGNKIKHTIKWFKDNEVSMFFGLIFTIYLAVLAIIHMKQSFFYILLFIYYISSAAIRLFNYAWHKRIQKKCGDNQIRDNRMSSWLLLFDSAIYLLFSNILVIGAIFMMIQKANTGTNIYLFLFILIPMAIVRFFTSNKSVRKNRKENNTYLLGVSLIGLVSVFFNLLEIVAISCHSLPIVWLRYVFIILAIIIAKGAVLVVSIIFVIHWFRSIILNRRSKERRWARQNRAK